MSAEGEAPVPHEVIIVRRRGGDGDDGHHGGAWKIAFADLMTAMMAFFLVMWLLNVSDKEKIQQIATYFNPLKLNSKRPTTKGVEDERETPKAQASEGPAQTGTDKSTVDDKKTHQGAVRPGGDGDLEEGVAQKAEEELFNDPYGVLARLALKATNGAERAVGAQTEGMLPGGDAYTNPFEPFADRPPATQKSELDSERVPPSLDEPTTQPKPLGGEKPLDAPPTGDKGNPATALGKLETEPPLKPGDETQDQAQKQSQKQAQDQKQAEAKKTAEDVRTLEGEIKTALQGIAPENRPAIDVKGVDEGLLISLTDDFRFGMFDSASAEPRPELVVVMEKLAKVLAERDGRILVRGHTDARPFRTEKNNNWRLSMARAQVAYYMLVRGGVTENRFDSIEGHPDRDLKVPADPNAAENRRIEILLRAPKP
jgi:chemotaxis protein MotB